MQKHTLRFVLLFFFLLLVAMLLPFAGYAAGNSFKDVSENHWARSAITAAVSQGYVSGYPDGTFQPNKEVTRAEFIRMLVDALDISHMQGTAPWYQGYVDAAVEEGIHDERDFSNYNGKLSRIEMAKLAIRAVPTLDSGNVANENEWMHLAVKTGIIHGMGKGELNFEGTSTRAQAVIVIDRIIRAKDGEQLPYDQEALLHAESLINPQYDGFGRKIRTWNLPKNHEEFPYILVDIPNEMYEMPYDKSFYPLGYKNSKWIHENFKSYHPDRIKHWLPPIEKYMNNLVNINYETIGREWAEEMAGYQSPFGDSYEDKVKAWEGYAEFVKENKIKVEGYVKLEPSMIITAPAKTSMRAEVEFKIVESKTYSKIFHFFNQPDKFLIGRVYKGYADVNIGNISSIPDDIDMKPLRYNSSIFANNNIKVQ